MAGKPPSLDRQFALAELEADIVQCRACPRLMAHCQRIGQIKRRAYRDEDYWAKPVPGWGPVDARLLIIGLAPGAHGANRTGRMFTGDRSGEFLYRALFDNGFANQPTSTARGDGLQLLDCRITAPVHCAPPANKPLSDELTRCREYLRREWEILPQVQVVVVLGRIALDAYRAVARLGPVPFAHGQSHPFDPVLITSYHPSQQNTQTGRLTAAMLHDVFRQARHIIESNVDRGMPAGPGVG